MRIVLLLCTIFTLFSCTGKYHVEGYIKGMTGEDAITVLRQLEGFRYDTVLTVPVCDGHFRLAMPLAIAGEACELQVGTRPGRPMFFVEPGNVTITGHVDSLFFARATGTRANDEWQRYRAFMQGISAQREKAMFAPGMQSLSEGEQATTRKLIMQEYEEQLARFQAELVGDGKSVAALFSYWQRYLAMSADDLAGVLQRFDSSLSSNRYYADIQARLTTLRRVAIGAEAPLFTATSLDGGEISLSDLRGKHVILDFWASWCMPCRAETKHLRSLYRQFRDRGLEIFSVSSDKDEQAWRHAIEQDTMTWRQGLLRGKNKDDVYALYGVVAIPSIWIISPDGKIIAKGLRGENLVSFCTGLFESSSSRQTPE